MTKEWKVEFREQCDLASAVGEVDFWSVRIDENLYKIEDTEKACLIHAILKCSDNISLASSDYECGEIKKSINKLTECLSYLCEKIH